MSVPLSEEIQPFIANRTPHSSVHLFLQIGQEHIQGVVGLLARLAEHVPTHRKRYVNTAPLGLLREVAVDDFDGMDAIKIGGDGVAGEQVAAQCHQGSRLFVV